jgi:hypothetical protein
VVARKKRRVWTFTDAVIPGCFYLLSSASATIRHVGPIAVVVKITIFFSTVVPSPKEEIYVSSPKEKIVPFFSQRCHYVFILAM